MQLALPPITTILSTIPTSLAVEGVDLDLNYHIYRIHRYAAYFLISPTKPTAARCGDESRPLPLLLHGYPATSDTL